MFGDITRFLVIVKYILDDIVLVLSTRLVKTVKVSDVTIFKVFFFRTISTTIFVRAMLYMLYNIVSMLILFRSARLVKEIDITIFLRTIPATILDRGIL